ncbi:MULTISPECIES: TIGR02391 family protein [unclassified Beijerinckia]|uniref:TIGR02391 family protein n=1 Tax=unclassified Beijerinckia TaxID=2638183 RepID=UPI00089B6406|nr:MULTISPECIES: TIGR02391 family protein [unclassified Beijerinckia]MDH7797912.1 uncharacterized protein (TIGR02391 family) [Beijerinckia sp. GAS462]SED02643.1 TIGR02391 family protein [Beijerinckia sp. 28-YEA-48]
MAFFTAAEIQAIAEALGDTEIGLTGSEIGRLLSSLRMNDVNASVTKRLRLSDALTYDQNARSNRTGILAFIRTAMKPTRWVGKREAFERLRARLNQALMLMGLVVKETGDLVEIDTAGTLSEAERRARELRADLLSRDIHPDVAMFCRSELLTDNYFHAVLEAVKSIGDKLRVRTGLLDDGAVLIDRALGGDLPILAINRRATKSEVDEQKGFVSLVKGTFGMFRNPAAHEAKLNWKMSREDAEDLMSLVSLIHRRLDKATMLPRT